MAVSFMLLWFPLMPVAIQFPLALCLYDTFLTAVDLVQSALLADLEESEIERANMSIYKSVFGAVGAASIFLSSLFWDSSGIFLLSFLYCCS
jgi:Na+/melibiose symporter-like transporter